MRRFAIKELKLLHYRKHRIKNFHRNRVLFVPVLVLLLVLLFLLCRGVVVTVSGLLPTTLHFTTFPCNKTVNLHKLFKLPPFSNYSPCKECHIWFFVSGWESEQRQQYLRSPWENFNDPLPPPPLDCIWSRSCKHCIKRPLNSESSLATLLDNYDVCFMLQKNGGQLKLNFQLSGCGCLPLPSSQVVTIINWRSIYRPIIVNFH